MAVRATRRLLWLASAALVAGCQSPPPADHPPAAPVAPPDVPAVTAGQIAQAEEARVGGMERLHARGVAELRTGDETGDRFEQGDLDLRWSRARGLAVSVSKLGERWVWLGADSAAWWVFELKTTPSRLHTGALTSTQAGLAPAFPWLMGVRPLRPAADAVPQAVDAGWRVRIDAPAGTLPAGGVVHADFSAPSLLPVAVELSLPGGVVWRSQFNGWMSVETPQTAQGAWPQLPRRVLATSKGEHRWAAVRVAFDTANADPAATERDALYDLARLQERFAPQVVEREE